MNFTSINSKTHHGINMLRGVFAILVVVAHSMNMAVKTFRPGFEETGIGRIIFSTLANGTYWVMGFFVISGFCIHLSVQNSYVGNRYSARSYLVARVTRIVPLYYIGLFVALAVEILLYRSEIRPPVWRNGIDVSTFLGNIFFTQHITGWFGSYAPAWSLTCEAAYYLIWPMALAVFRYRAGIAAISAAFISVLAAVAIAFYDSHNLSVHLSGAWMVCYMSVLWYAGAFLAEEWTRIKGVRMAVLLSYLWLPGLVGVYALETLGFINLHIRNLLPGPVFVALIVNIDTWPDWVFKRPAWFTNLGHLSYPLYLFHGPFLVTAGAFLVSTGMHFHFMVVFVALLSAALLMGYLVGIPLEVAFLEWRKIYLQRFSREHNNSLQKNRAYTLD